VYSSDDDEYDSIFNSARGGRVAVEHTSTQRRPSAAQTRAAALGRARSAQKSESPSPPAAAEPKESSYSSFKAKGARYASKASLDSDEEDDYPSLWGKPRYSAASRAAASTTVSEKKAEARPASRPASKREDNPQTMKEIKSIASSNYVGAPSSSSSAAAAPVHPLAGASRSYVGASPSSAAPAHPLAGSTSRRDRLLAEANAEQVQEASKRSSASARSKASRADKQVEKVVLWDLDDTLIVWDSLNKGTFDMDPDLCKELWDEWFSLSKAFQEESLFGSRVGKAQSEGVVDGAKAEPLHSLDSLTGNASIDDAYGTIHDKFANKTDRQVPASLEKKRKALYSRLDKATGGWLTEGRETLRLCQQKEGVLNVLVTASRLMAAVSKLILFELNESIGPDQIFSCWMRGTKKDAFRKLQTKYSGARFVAVGDGKQEKQASEELKIPFFHVKDMKTLHLARKNLQAHRFAVE